MWVFKCICMFLYVTMGICIPQQEYGGHRTIISCWSSSSHSFLEVSSPLSRPASWLKSIVYPIPLPGRVLKLLMFMLIGPTFRRVLNLFTLSCASRTFTYWVISTSPLSMTLKIILLELSVNLAYEKKTGAILEKYEATHFEVCKKPFLTC